MTCTFSLSRSDQEIKTFRFQSFSSKRTVKVHIIKRCPLWRTVVQKMDHL